MKAQSTTQPAIYKTGVSNGWATVFLRENIAENHRETDEGMETYYEYDEYKLRIRDREGLDSFVSENFDALLLSAKEQACNEAFQRMNKEVNHYIYSHYDAGTQASFLSLYADPSTPQSGKAAIESVWQWIKSVMAHYYAVKAQLLAGTVVQWDFIQFDATDPGVQLSDFMGQ